MGRRLAPAIALLATLAFASSADAVTTITVNSAGSQADPNPGTGGCDTDLGTPGSQCTLRGAIQEANAVANSGGSDQIQFAVMGLQTITPASNAEALPDISDPVTIDALASAPGANPQWMLDGVNTTAKQGFKVLASATGTVILGIAVGRFAGGGIETAAANTFIGYGPIGTDVTGTVSRGNGAFGVRATAGDLTINASFLPLPISNTTSGPGIDLVAVGSGTPKATISGVNVGTNIGRDVAMGNSGNGINVGNRWDLHLEGGTISGNSGDGISVTGTSTPRSVEILSSQIGLGISPLGGTVAIGNGDDGIDTAAAGTVDIIGNEIGGNIGNGVLATGPVLVRGNAIGVDTAGIDRGNGSGVYVNAPSTIGGTGAADRNTISGNEGNGVTLEKLPAGPSLAGTNVENNVIGLSQAGAVVENGDSGVVVDGSANGAITVKSNVLSGNHSFGARVNPGSGDGLVFTGNLIGTDATGADKGNGWIGLSLDGSKTKVGDGTVAGRNTVANSKGLEGFSDGIRITGQQNTIQNNVIRNNAGQAINLIGTANGSAVAPSVTQAVSGDNRTRFRVQVPSSSGLVPGHGYTVDLYRDAQCDPDSGGMPIFFNGEGETPVARVSGLPGLFGDFDVTGTVDGPQMTGVLTATLTHDSTGDTSEFGPCLPITPGPATSLNTAALSVPEGENVDLGFTRGPNTTEARIGASDAPGTATPGNGTFGQGPPGTDYQDIPAGGFSVYQPGATTGSVFLQTFEDTLDEPDETFTVTIFDQFFEDRFVAPTTATITTSMTTRLRRLRRHRLLRRHRHRRLRRHHRRRRRHRQWARRGPRGRSPGPPRARRHRRSRRSAPARRPPSSPASAGPPRIPTATSSPSTSPC